MTSFINFTISTVSSPPFQAQVILDSQPYNLTTNWNLFGSRLYFNLVSIDGTIIGSRALVESTAGVSISALSWGGGKVTLTTAAPHGLKTGQLVTRTVSGVTPDAHNGVWQCLATGPSTLTYPLSSPPGAASILGSLTYDINLVGGLSDPSGNPLTSTLVFRNQTFEVNP